MKRSLLALTGIVLLASAFSLPAAKSRAASTAAQDTRLDAARKSHTATKFTTPAELKQLREKNALLLRTRQTTPKYCRYDIIDGGAKVWWIYPVTPDDFVNYTGDGKARDWQIIESNIVPSGAPIEILVDDQILVSKSGTVVSLVHFNGSGGAKPNSPNSPALKSGGGGLWVEGEAHTSAGLVGTYYLYKLDDRPTCKHREKSGTSCRQIHVEFFDTSLTDWRPEVGGTILPIEHDLCISGELETDDGDGDEGLR